MSDCLFCKILAGEIPSDKIYEDDKMFVFKDINPQADVHLLAIPRVHISSLNEVTDEHDDVMAHMIKQLPKLAKEQDLNDGFRTIINTGAGGGQVVYHLHMHLLGGSRLPGFH